MSKGFLHVIGSLDTKNGGTYTALISIIKMLDAAGHSNFVVATSTANEEFDNSFFANRYILFKKSFPKKFRQSSEGNVWLEENISNYDGIVIHEIWGGLGIAASLKAMNKNVPYYIWPHGSLDPFDLNKKKALKKVLGKLILKKILFNAKAICCTSEEERKRLVVYNKNSKKSNFEILPLMVDYNGINEGNGDVFREKYDIAKTDFVFLFLSRINYKKGIDVLLNAFHQLLQTKNIPSAKLVIAGTGTKDYVAEIESLAKTLGLSNQVVFTGQLSGKNKADAFMGSDVFVLPSKNENFGIAIIEALQTSTPIIITKDVYIYQELFNENHQPGWICAYTKESVYECMLKATENKNNLKLKDDALAAGNHFQLNGLLPLYKKVYK